MERLNNWTNLAYLAPPTAAFLSGDPSLHVLGFSIAWLWLLVGSWGGHRYETPAWWKADVTGMLAALISVTAGAWTAHFGLWIWHLAPIPVVAYLAVPSRVIREAQFRNLHVGLWAALGAVGLALATWKVVFPLALFGLYVASTLWLSDGEDLWHALSHVIAAAAGTLGQLPILSLL